MVSTSGNSGILLFGGVGGGRCKQPLCGVCAQLVLERLIAAREHELRFALQYGNRDFGAVFLSVNS